MYIGDKGNTCLHSRDEKSLGPLEKPLVLRRLDDNNLSASGLEPWTKMNSLFRNKPHSYHSHPKPISTISNSPAAKPLQSNSYTSIYSTSNKEYIKLKFIE